MYSTANQETRQVSRHYLMIRCCSAASETTGPSCLYPEGEQVEMMTVMTVTMLATAVVRVMKKTTVMTAMVM